MIHLIRHGETDGNGAHYVGRQDLPLNAAGRAQAEALVPLLSARPICRIIASPLQRARCTAAPLASALGLRVEIAPALIEIDFGQLENAFKSEHALSLRNKHRDEPLPGGESLLNVWDRLQPFAHGIAQGQNQDCDLVIVGHYWSLRMLHGIVSGLSFDQTVASASYKPKTGSVAGLILPDGGAKPSAKAPNFLNNCGMVHWFISTQMALTVIHPYTS
jgi:broad specificity phosphatase PhoE